MMVKVTFTGVVYQQKLLIWEYNPETNLAQLTFKCEGDDEVCNAADVVNFLKAQEFSSSFDFPHGKVIIQDVERFSKICPMINNGSTTLSTAVNHVKILPLVDSPDDRDAPAKRSSSSEHRRSSSPRTLFQHVSSAPRLLRSTSSPRLGGSVVKPEQQGVADIKTPSNSKEEVQVSAPKSDTRRDDCSMRKNYLSISLPDLILETDFTLFGDTLAVFGKFQRLTEDKAQAFAPHLRIQKSFEVAIQLDKNRAFYPAKEQLMTQVKVLFELLNSVYSGWASSQAVEIRRSLYFYLQEAVSDMITNSTFNKTPTEFEKLSDEDLEREFKGNKALLSFAIQESRAARAKVMLGKLSYLVGGLPPEILALIPGHNSELLGETTLKIGVPLEAVAPLPKHDPDLLPEDNDKRLSEAKFRQVALIAFQGLICEKPALREEIRARIQLLSTYIIMVKELEKHYDIMLKDLPSKMGSEQIGEFYSFRHLIRNHLIRRFTSIDKHNTKIPNSFDMIAEVVCSTMITKLRGATGSALAQLVPKLISNEMDKDFYLSRHWALGVKHSFTSVDLTKLMQHPGNKKLVKTFIQELVKVVYDYFEQESAIIQSSAVQRSSSFPETNSLSSSVLNSNG